MRFLLDTHVFLWWLFDEPRLSAHAREAIGEPANEILISAASAWEISTKHRLGKLPDAAPLVQDLPGWIGRAGFVELPVQILHAQRAGALTHAHRDPFDRMLAAQGAIEDIPLITKDAKLLAFGIRSFW